MLRSVTKCPHRTPPKLGYCEWHADAERREKQGQSQIQCPVCKLWVWEVFYTRAYRSKLRRLNRLNMSDCSVDDNYVLPYDFLDVEHATERPPVPVPFVDGDYVLRIVDVELHERRDGTGRILYRSVVEEGPKGTGDVYIDRPVLESISLQYNSAPWHLQLAQACFGVAGAKQRLARTEGRLAPRTLVGRRYRAKIAIREGYTVVIDRKPVNPDGSPYR